MEDKTELLKKIKKLAENGINGEKDNAQKILENIMKKYNITDEDLSEDLIKEFDICVNRNKIFEEELFHQICYSVFGNIDECKQVYYYTHNKTKSSVTCTNAEFIEIEAKFDHYKRVLKKQLQLFYSAFVQAEEIFPPDNLVKEKISRDLTEEDMKVLSLAEKLDKHSYIKQIENKEN